MSDNFDRLFEEAEAANAENKAKATRKVFLMSKALIVYEILII